MAEAEKTERRQMKRDYYKNGLALEKYEKIEDGQGEV